MQLMREKEVAKLQLEREKQQAYFAMKQQEFEAEAPVVPAPVPIFGRLLETKMRKP